MLKPKTFFTKIKVHHLLLFFVVILGGYITSIPFVKHYPFLPGFDSPLYLYRMEKIARGYKFPITASFPPLLSWILGTTKKITHFNSYYIIASFIIGLSMIQIIGIYFLTLKIIKNNKYIAVIASFLSIGVFAKYRISWDLYNNFFSATVLILLLTIYTSPIRDFRKQLLLATLLSTIIFYSHPLVGSLLIGLSISLNIVYLLIHYYLRKTANQESKLWLTSFRKLIILILTSTIFGFLLAWPFTSQFFLGFSRNGYSLKKLVSNNLIHDKQVSATFNLIELFSKLPYQKQTYLTHLQKPNILGMFYGLFILFVSLIVHFKKILVGMKPVKKRYNFFSSLIIFLYTTLTISLSQSRILGISLVQDRFVLMLFFVAPILEAIAIYSLKLINKKLFYLMGGMILTVYSSIYLRRTISLVSISLGSFISPPKYEAIKYLKQIGANNQSVVVISNNLHRYWILALIPDVTYKFGEYYLISGVKWKKTDHQISQYTDSELLASILTTNSYALSVEESYKILLHKFSNKKHIYLFMRRGEPPGYTDWKKFFNNPDRFKLLYDKNDFLIFEVIK